MCLNYCLKILLAWFGIKFDPLILNKKSAEKNVSIIFALQKKYEFYWIRKKSLPKKHQKLLDGRDFRFTSFWGGWFKHLSKSFQIPYRNGSYKVLLTDSRPIDVML